MWLTQQVADWQFFTIYQDSKISQYNACSLPAQWLCVKQWVQQQCSCILAMSRSAKISSWKKTNFQISSLEYFLAFLYFPVRCSIGTYYHHRLCRKCEKGMYQDEEGATECKLCPHGTTNHVEGATNVAECKGMSCRERESKVTVLLKLCL